MIKVFDTQSQFEAYTADGMQSGDLYFVNENESVHFRTNNIDGNDTSYNIGNSGGTPPTGNITITENGDNIDVAEYATATVNVQPPQPTYNELQSDEEGQAFIPCQNNDILEIICSNESTVYAILGTFDSNKEFISLDVQATSISKNSYTFWVMVDESNAAYVLIADTAGSQFTARYRKLN